MSDCNLIQVNAVGSNNDIKVKLSKVLSLRLPALSSPFKGLRS